MKRTKLATWQAIAATLLIISAMGIVGTIDRDTQDVPTPAEAQMKADSQQRDRDALAELELLTVDRAKLRDNAKQQVNAAEDEFLRLYINAGKDGK